MQTQSPPQTVDKRSHLPATAGEALRYFVSSPSPVWIAVLIIFSMAWRWRLGPWTWADTLVVIGLLAYWPLNEWLIHTRILHVRPRRIFGVLFDIPVARSHRAHHASPWKLELVFVPLHIHCFASVLLLVTATLFPDVRLLWTLLSGYLLLGLHYEWVHYLAHIRYEPTFYSSRIKEHRLHHFRHEKYWWGVSTGLADRWLRTAPDVNIPRSEFTADILGKGAVEPADK